MIPHDKAAEIVRLAQAEKWPPGTIASQLGVHHSVVSRVLGQQAFAKGLIQRPSIIDPYLPFVIETLAKYPRLPASRLYQMVLERGYRGAPDHFRVLIARHRPKPVAEAFLRLRTLPGEQGQVDWGDFGKLDIDGAARRLFAFVMVLSYSRSVFLFFSLGAAMGAFLRAHVQAFEHFGGVPRTLLYDNLKSAVIERVGDAIRFNPTLLDLASHYRFQPKPVAVARGNEKGRVERAIRYVRTSFFPARSFRDVDDLNAQALVWMKEVADHRPCPEDRHRKVCEVFGDERQRLLPLPDAQFPAEDRVVVHVGKTPYVPFHLNDNSIPHDRVRRSLTVVASSTVVRIIDGVDEIASHPRCWGKGKQIEDASHVQELAALKSHAREQRGMDRLHHACPSCQRFFQLVAERGGNLGATTVGLTRLLDTFGAEALDAALTEAIAGDTAHLGAVRHLLDQQRQARHQPPPVMLHLSDTARALSRPVRAHRLSTYDQLRKREGGHDVDP
jgi:transposase